jgi:hypothetical protein
MSMRATLLGCVSLLSVTACDQLATGKDAKVPGEPLGTFHVTGNLEGSSCGPDALGSAALWEFDVQLSRDGNDLYWLNGREAVYGRLGNDGRSFVFDTRVQVDAQQAKGAYPGCTLIRNDSATGKLSSADLDVEGFSGMLRFDFSAKAGGDCAALLGQQGGLAALPCDMSYELEGLRTEKP